MDRIASSTFYGSMGSAMSVLREHGYPTDALKPPSLLNYMRSTQPPQVGQESGVAQKPAATEGVKVELSRDSVEISVGPELAKSLKSADLGKLFESLYNTPQVKSALARINDAA